MTIKLAVLRPIICTLSFFLTCLSAAAAESPSPNSHECSEMEVRDIGMGMCMPLPMAGMPMTMLMLHGNAFGVYTSGQGPRGRDALFSTNMVMADLGTSIGDINYLNVDFMGTAEKWTVPSNGYPLLLQIGENQANGQPFLDAQHPHNSPIMGLTLSDTIKLKGENKNYLKLFFAPRGEATDGPIAFMHRTTGMVNPLAPLGHHIGQDVGHITSTVIGGSLKLGNTHLEASTYHGAEPQPTKVDLPIGAPDSGSFRAIQEFSPDHLAMASIAYVHNPEPDQPDITNELRYSASLYDHFHLSAGWTLHNTLIYGAVTRYDHATLLNSIAEEFLFKNGQANIWGRVEVLQRTPEELGISNLPNQSTGRWVAAFTFGCTHHLAHVDQANLGVGAALTKTLLPNDFIGSYEGNPWAGQIFIQVAGMKMWDL